MPGTKRQGTLFAHARHSSPKFCSSIASSLAIRWFTNTYIMLNAIAHRHANTPVTIAFPLPAPWDV